MIRKLVFILVLFSGVLCAQVKINIIPEQRDFHEHYWASHLINGGVTSLVYYKTKKVGVSMLAGTLVSLAAGLGKEFIWDRAMGRGVYSTKDIEADIEGNVSANYVMGISFCIHFKNKK